MSETPTIVSRIFLTITSHIFDHHFTVFESCIFDHHHFLRCNLYWKSMKEDSGVILHVCMQVVGGLTVEPLYKGHAGTMKNCPLYRGVLYSEIKLYTKVLALDQKKCPL